MRRKDDNMVSDYKSFEAFLRVEEEAKMIEMKYNKNISDKERKRKTSDLKKIRGQFQKKRKQKFQKDDLKIVAESIKRKVEVPVDEDRKELRKRLFSPLEEIKKKYTLSKEDKEINQNDIEETLKKLKEQQQNLRGEYAKLNIIKVERVISEVFGKRDKRNRKICFRILKTIFKREKFLERKMKKAKKGSIVIAKKKVFLVLRENWRQNKMEKMRKLKEVLKEENKRAYQTAVQFHQFMLKMKSVNSWRDFADESIRLKKENEGKSDLEKKLSKFKNKIEMIKNQSKGKEEEASDMGLEESQELQRNTMQLPKPERVFSGPVHAKTIDFGDGLQFTNTKNSFEARKKSSMKRKRPPSRPSIPSRPGSKAMRRRKSSISKQKIPKRKNSIRNTRGQSRKSIRNFQDEVEKKRLERKRRQEMIKEKHEKKRLEKYKQQELENEKLLKEMKKDRRKKDSAILRKKKLKMEMKKKEEMTKERAKRLKLATKDMRERNLLRFVFGNLKKNADKSKNRFRIAQHTYDDKLKLKTFSILKVIIEDKRAKTRMMNQIRLKKMKNKVRLLKKKLVFNCLKKIKSKSQNFEVFCKQQTQINKLRAVWRSWTTTIPELKKENFLVRKAQKEKIKEFRRKTLLESSFRNWSSYTREVKKVEDYTKEKEEMMSKVKGWLKEYDNL